jgi:hypothetical protein
MDSQLQLHADLVTLHLIQEDIIFSKNFKKFVPVLEAEIENYSKDPKCPCRDKIISYVKINREGVANFIEYFLKENPQVTIDIQKIIDRHKPKDIRGKIFKIAKTEEAYFNFVSYIISNGFIFRQFSVTSEQDFWVIFFL